MNKKERKTNANIVEANGSVCEQAKNRDNKITANTARTSIARPTFEEPTQNKITPKNHPNLISNLQPLKSHYSNLTSHTGITLIALVITIIVMLILVGVTVTIALNGGLFNQAKVATKNTDVEKQKEKELSTGRVKVGDMWYDSYEDYANSGGWKLSEDGKRVMNEEVILNVGDYVKYNPDSATYTVNELSEDYTGYANTEDLTTENLKWRVLGVDEKGYLTLVANYPTSKLVHFQGAKGYNNGVYILNDICKTLYSNKDLGIKARNLKIEDIEAGFSDDGFDARDTYVEYEVQYGQSKTYTTNLQYPVIYAQENGSGIGVLESEKETGIKTNGIGGSYPFYIEETKEQLITKEEGTESKTANGVLTCTQTYYKWSSTPKNYCEDQDNFYNMIFNTGKSYWLASRYTYCLSDYAGFGLRTVYNAGPYGSRMFNSYDGVTGYAHSLRPVVSLGSNIKVEKCKQDATGIDEEHMHTLSS